MLLDFKKTQKDLYQPKTSPHVIDVPEMTFITVDGKGDPNTSAEYSSAVELLYGLSYAIKMGNKSVLEYVVPPLEGFWNVADDFKGGGAVITDKSKFLWTMLIRQPDFVTADVFEAAKTVLSKKKPNLDTLKARLEIIIEGLCVQIMHIGSYDSEPATVAAIDRFAAENGYVIDIGDIRRHHEIYLSDPRKVAPEKLRTVIRHPIRKLSDGLAKDTGPFYHGTKANLCLGALLEPGYKSNYGTGKKANFIYLTATLDAAVWGAELAAGDGPGKIYIVEPTGEFEDDPNLTDKKFPGNPTRSYRTRYPLQVVGEVLEWKGHSPETLQSMLDHLEKLRKLGVEAINE